MKFYRHIEPVKAISFDLDDTLYDNHPLMLIAEKKLQSFIREQHECCRDTDIKFWRHHKIRLLKETPELCNDMGELRRRTLTAGFAQKGLSDSKLQGAVDGAFDYFYFERSNFKVNETIRSLLEKLANRVPLVAITNGNVNLDQIGIEEYFAKTYKASLAQPMKPHPKMFELTQAFVGVPTGNILHVGDNMEKDVMGARQAGFSTAWFACNRAMKIKTESVNTLPDVELNELEDLLLLVER